ncbi:hypothetical protein CHGG_07411 [Chaetomium globosum CBS 148.51]|uniref:Serum paraoxonase/arylesterase family protein n=1 Tax=Chaetomium globosum (strain ATCC 6205 / CBS 148.51 / DSM 1962 / NBRC 6347 / NRRL 1970) TaxID=306901 RepID=Q2GX93_CHAGB|nr:uncharacterized protein CHGG_07411 [Chaetomium globosum CBS 148.51]EAQ86158.1 hypothetical protein CHGG_07411 [Chaetomium globosum CBS 148.51]
MRSLTFSLLGALLAYVLYTVGPLVHRTAVVIGALRNYPNDATVKGEVIAIPDTVHCEDLHYHAPSGTLFTACEDNAETRFKWFPPLANFQSPELASKSQGSLHVIDPKSMKSRRLTFENFDGPFITHGIDVIPDQERPGGEAVYIFAINHVPETQPSGEKGPHARSQLELFHHIIGSSSAKHIRSIWHPLVITPNDIFAQSVNSIYVTNDHRHRYPGLKRALEDIYSGAKWTEVVHVQLDSLTVTEAAAGVTANVALSNLHNANGLSHGRSNREILIASCTSGILHIGQLPADGAGNITVVESVTVDHVADNPSYFADPYATPGDDKSGFLETGLARAIELGDTHRDPAAKDPVMVTYLKPISPGHWEKRVLFHDDGTTLRSGSAGVLVAIDPAVGGSTGGTRQAWLFVTGFMSKSIIATKVDL